MRIIVFIRLKTRETYKPLLVDVNTYKSRHIGWNRNQSKAFIYLLYLYSICYFRINVLKIKKIMFSHITYYYNIINKFPHV